MRKKLLVLALIFSVIIVCSGCGRKNTQNVNNSVKTRTEKPNYNRYNNRQTEETIKKEKVYKEFNPAYSDEIQDINRQVQDLFYQIMELNKQIMEHPEKRVELEAKRAELERKRQELDKRIKETRQKIIDEYDLE